ncbi:MAG: undecaprenyl-diphosphate phosphatase, partial [Patescibacteria group bacterium]|nr:undecaprenyl-diphosphate phosphatase [Patescibacteria group bacterium]
FLADKFSARTCKMETMTLKSSFFIGIAQVFALIPGVSRSGMTIAGARVCGFTREDAARFSFLIATPIIAGAGLMQFKYLVADGITGVMFVGVLVSFVAAVMTIHYFLAFIKKVSYAVFLYYSLGLLAVVSITFYI